MVWVVYAFFAFIVWALTQETDTREALMVTPIWFVVLAVAWALIRRRPEHRARYAAFRKDLEDEAAAEHAARD